MGMMMLHRNEVTTEIFRPFLCEATRVKGRVKVAREERDQLFVGTKQFQEVVQGFVQEIVGFKVDHVANVLRGEHPRELEYRARAVQFRPECDAIDRSVLDRIGTIPRSIIQSF